MEKLHRELKRHNVPDTEDIVEEYRQHFCLRIADGFTQEEVAVKLGSPVALAAQFEGDAVSGFRKALTVSGLCVADVLAVGFFALLAAWEVVMAALCLGCAALSAFLLMGVYPPPDSCASVLVRRGAGGFGRGPERARSGRRHLLLGLSQTAGALLADLPGKRDGLGRRAAHDTIHVCESWFDRQNEPALAHDGAFRRGPVCRRHGAGPDRVHGFVRRGGVLACVGLVWRFRALRKPPCTESTLLRCCALARGTFWPFCFAGGNTPCALWIGMNAWRPGERICGFAALGIWIVQGYFLVQDALYRREERKLARLSPTA